MTYRRNFLSVFLFVLLAGGGAVLSAPAQLRHEATSRYPAYAGLVMCGYQGWFRAPEDGAHEGWGHYAANGRFDAGHLHTDYWPDVTEYEKTYPTALTNRDGTPARVFSSWDQSTTDRHFQWMQEYGIDGVFVQRFFAPLRTAAGRHQSRVVLEHALIASRKYDRAMAVMYDLSGLKARGEDCSAIIQDWKELVDELHLTSQGARQTYLYDHGRPVVAIWGVGFVDRPYDIHAIGLEKLIDFLKHDPIYGGCAVMLGVPTHFRTLDGDCLPDPWVQQVIGSADLIMPWLVGRFTPLDPHFQEHYTAQITADLAWCAARRLEYVPCVYPGFSWHNLSQVEFPGADHPLGQIPRQQGRFYWDQITTATGAGAKMLYVAMFDEMDEGTAIFKCTSQLPVGGQFLDFEGLPSDHYLWLTGQAGKLLRGEIPQSKGPPGRGGDGLSPQMSPAKSHP